ncbi:rust resistance kinase Lr10-like [Juglans microcarpa x Juglans regia]|uniref:rust resistance kinase Lr10-like n=1 Tax=Juglans microcarpa x Juglans regia TaxID=2249226 RepID=UPI001B7DB38D|nr:rust resistance kinase Lr10-like [Juglans microcarpa x Juglans regia]
MGPRNLQTTEMSIVSSKMAISFFFLVVVSVAGLGEGQINHGCDVEEHCGSSGLPIKFPFRLNTQPEHCGYPRFNLSCTGRNEIQLQLPNLVKFIVAKIDYQSQRIQVSDPDKCFPKQLQQVKSYDPFNYTNKSAGDFALYSCHPPERDSYGELIPCLTKPGQNVYAFPSEQDITNLPLASCTKMYNLRSFPVTPGGDDMLELEWVIPNCRDCAKNQTCRLKRNGTETETECFPKTHKDKKSTLVTAGSIVGSFLLALAVCALYRLYRYDKLEKENQIRIQRFLEDYRNLKPTRYSYADIKRITNQFAEKLGQGAYGTVFKGKLSNEIFVAVKILNSSKGNGEEFINEVGTMGRIHHVNVVRMVGFCADGFRRALVYEYLPNDSLEKFISSADAKNRFLGWEKLQDIALGIARGIEYLHQGCDQRILHFDIKPHNVLLDENFNPKISDFGLAKLCSKDQSAVSMTTARGTVGYIAPEVFSRNFGNVSYKADVYSFGMLLLEAVGGRKHVDVTPENAGQIYFPEWIYNLLEEKEDLRLLIENDEDAKIAKKLGIVGLWCIQWHPADRPSMKTVVQMLVEGEGNNFTMPPNPFASAGSTRMMNPAMPPRRLNQELEAIPELEE